MKHILLGLALLPQPSLAAQLAPVSLGNIISAVGPNWNANAHYKAVLMREGEYAALYLFRGPFDQAPLAYAPYAAITGERWGAVPWLAFDESGALRLYSENRVFGRNKWENTLTIIERNGRFMVSAFTSSSYDSLNPDEYTDCEIDLLARVLIVNGTPITPYPLATDVPVEAWSEDLENVCFP
jgi:hypothetical protein